MNDGNKETTKLIGDIVIPLIRADNPDFDMGEGKVMLFVTAIVDGEEDVSCLNYRYDPVIHNCESVEEASEIGGIFSLIGLTLQRRMPKFFTDTIGQVSEMSPLFDILEKLRSTLK